MLKETPETPRRVAARESQAEPLPAAASSISRTISQEETDDPAINSENIGVHSRTDDCNQQYDHSNESFQEQLTEKSAVVAAQELHSITGETLPCTFSTNDKSHSFSLTDDNKTEPTAATLSQDCTPIENEGSTYQQPRPIVVDQISHQQLPGSVRRLSVQPEPEDFASESHLVVDTSKEEEKKVATFPNSSSPVLEFLPDKHAMNKSNRNTSTTNVKVVSPTGKMAHKMAQMQDSSSLAVSASHETEATADSTIILVDHHRQSWSEKEEERQLKRAKINLAVAVEDDANDNDNYGQMPGSYAIGTPSQNLLIHQESTSRSSLKSSDQDTQDEENQAGDALRPQGNMTLGGVAVTNLYQANTAAASASNSNLIQATLVDPVFAEAVDEEAESLRLKRRRFRMIVAVNLFLGAIGVALLIFFLVRNKNGGNADQFSGAPSVAPSTVSPTTLAPTTYNPFHLPSDTWNAILAKPNSPHAQAYDWLLIDSKVSSTYDDDMVAETATTTSRSSSSSNNDGNNNQEWRYHQRYALALLKFTTDTNSSWKQISNWLDHDEHECRWHSTASLDGTANPCYDDADTSGKSTPQGLPGQYKILHLRRNGLRGTLPEEIFQLLPRLQSIQLGENDLTGSISSAIGQVDNLQTFNVSRNQLQGTIPMTIYKLTKLKYLGVNNNSLHGILSSQVGALTNLKELLIEHNGNMDGTLPTELGLLTSLARFKFQDNQFNTTIPSEIGRLAHLYLLHGHENRIWGTIPSEIGQLSYLLELSLHNNWITGPICSEIGLLSSIINIVLEVNNMTSTIPTEFGNLTTLKRLLLKDNLLTGTLPSELGLMDQIIVMLVQRNHLEGTIPSDLGRPTTWKRILLHENNFNGTIPLSLFDSPNLERLLLYDNKLVGNISQKIGVLSHIKDLWIHHNQLSGTLPLAIGLLTSLQSLRINDNNLRGMLPPEVQFLQNLEFLDLSSTSISGAIPEELCYLNDSQLVFDCSYRLCGCRCFCAAQSPQTNGSGSSTLNPSSHTSEVLSNYSFGFVQESNTTTNDRPQTQTEFPTATTTSDNGEDFLNFADENTTFEVDLHPSSAPDIWQDMSMATEKNVSANVSQQIAPAPEGLDVYCSFRSVATFSGRARCLEVCMDASCCWDGSEEFCVEEIECPGYGRCSNLMLEGLQTILDAACEEVSDMTDCLVMCSSAACCFATDMTQACDVSNPGIACEDYQACEVLEQHNFL